MSFIINAELSDAVVAQGLPVYTAQQIGAAPLDPTTGKILSSYLPDQASLDLEVDEKIANNSVKLGAQWTTQHTTSTGNPYVVGSIVYNAGRVYRCIAENDSIPPQQGGNPYWADLGVGYLLPNENPKIKGGSIDTRVGAVTQQTYETGDPENPTETENSLNGGNGGTITLKGGFGGFDREGGGIGGNSGSLSLAGGSGANGVGGNGGSIYLQGGEDTANSGNINLSGGSSVGNGGSIISIGASGDNYNGGTLDMSASSDGNGGSINTSSKGGSINTSGYDSKIGGSLNLSAGESGAGGSMNGSDKGGFIKFYGTGTNGNGQSLGTGGSIDISAGPHSGGTGPIWSSNGVGGNGGSIQLLGGAGGEESNAGNGGNGGTIIGNGGSAIPIGQSDVGEAILGTGYNGGTINFSAGSIGAGGNIDISNGGGSINTRGVGSIQLGVVGTRTTLNGSASGSDKTITLPNATGTIALTSDVRFGAKTVFTLGGDEKIIYALGVSYVYGGQITRGSKVSGGLDQTGLHIQGNWTITGLVIMANYPSAGTAGVTYGLVKINNASSVTNLWTAPSTSGLNNGLNTINNNLNVSISDGDKIGFQLTIGSTAGATVPTNANPTTITAYVYCVPR